MLDGADAFYVPAINEIATAPARRAIQAGRVSNFKLPSTSPASIRSKAPSPTTTTAATCRAPRSRHRHTGHRLGRAAPFSGKNSSVTINGDGSGSATLTDAMMLSRGSGSESGAIRWTCSPAAH
jgi:hypothetical protein